MQIEREWHQHPGWFASLDHSAQVRLLAMRRAEAKLAEKAAAKAAPKAQPPGPRPPRRR